MYQPCIYCFSLPAPGPEDPSFEIAAGQLLSCAELPEGCLALRLVFFSVVASDSDYLRKLAALERAASRRFAGGAGDRGVQGSGTLACGAQDFVPVVTLVAQPPLDGPLALEVQAVEVAGAENGTTSACEPTPSRGPSSLLEWPRREGGRPQANFAQAVRPGRGARSPWPAKAGILRITSHEHRGYRYLFIDGGGCRQIIAGGIFFPVAGGDLADGGVAGVGQDFFGRSKAAMDVVHGILTECRFDTHDIVRQWNYIEDITAEKDGLQNYQQFNDARAAFYDNSTWPAGYPAATGIGASGGGVVVEFDAASCGDGIHIVPVDNRLQVAAYSYSQDVLAGGGSVGRGRRVERDGERLRSTANRRQAEGRKACSNGRGAKEEGEAKSPFSTACPRNVCNSTPKFERAKMITSPGGYKLYISGTAAIRGQESLATDDVAAQTAATMENIEELLSAAQALAVPFASPATRARLLNLRVYIKRSEDFAAVRECLAARYPAVPVICILADICREELLVEIEALAYVPNL